MLTKGNAEGSVQVEAFHIFHEIYAIPADELLPRIFFGQGIVCQLRVELQRDFFEVRGVRRRCLSSIYTRKCDRRRYLRLGNACFGLIPSQRFLQQMHERLRIWRGSDRWRVGHL